MPTPVEDVKARLDVVDVIGEYVRLKPGGANHKGLCPFHGEKTPSFMVSRDKQIWHCFGCGEGGDVISFVQKIEGLDFPDTLRMLADRTGVELRQTDPQVASQRNRLLEILDLAGKYWHKILLDHPSAADVRAYLGKRGITDESIETFNLGFAPDSWDATLKFLNERKFKTEDIFAAGLAVKKDRGSGFYDRFRGRLIFPIQNVQGQTVGAGARTLRSDDGAGAKYINTPQTAAYDKSSVLYNLHRAKMEAKNAGQLILVEGYMDVIAAWQAGTRNVAAVSGTALTTEQIRLIKRYAPSVALSFDTDAAGQSAARRGIDLAMGADLDIKVITLADGQDPDDAIRENPQIWKDAIAGAQSIMAYYFEQVKKNHDLKTVEGKKQGARILLGVISKLADRVEQAHWVKTLAAELEVPEDVLYESLRGAARRTSGTAGPAPAASASATPERITAADRLLALAMAHPAVLAELPQSLPSENLEAGPRRDLYTALISYYSKGQDSLRSQGNAGNSFDFKAFSQGLAPELSALAGKLSLLGGKDFAGIDAAEARDEAAGMAASLQRDHLHAQLQAVEARFKRAEASGDRAVLQQLSARFTELTQQLAALG